MRFNPGVDVLDLDSRLTDMLYQAEALGNVEFVITSAYREGDPRCHGLRKAVDISAPSSRDRYKVTRGLLRAGFERIGIYDRHIHVDVCEEPKYPGQVLWIGVSK